MKINNNTNKIFKLMKKYFVNKLGFISIEGENLYEDATIDCELHLINRDSDFHIDLIKYNNDNEIYGTLQGYSIESSELRNEYSLCVSYFLNRKGLIQAGKDDFVKKLDEEMQNLKKS